MICVGTKRGVNYGLVYNAEGVVIGRVCRHAKVARKALGGGTQPFWTAVPIYSNIYGGVEASASLGTRHQTRSSALGAIRAFWQTTQPSDVCEAAERVRRTSRVISGEWPGRWHYAVALGQMVARFKADHRAICGMAAR